jgi:hypothetical protein
MLKEVNDCRSRERNRYMSEQQQFMKQEFFPGARDGTKLRKQCPVRSEAGARKEDFRRCGFRGD